MSRTPGATCLIDIRSAALCQDHVISTDPCAPGAAQAASRRKFYGAANLLDNCEPPACGYDRGKDFISTVGAFLIISTCLGIIHTFGLLLPAAAIQYEAGYIELNLVATMTYTVALLSACVAYPVMEYAGHRLTAIFGMTFVFVGVLIDSQAFHISILYVANILLVGVGTGLAYASAATLPSDLFRSKILTALTVVNISGNFGTIFYTWFGSLLIDVLGFRWTKLMMAVLVLFFTLAVHVFPKTRLLYPRCTVTSTGAMPSPDKSSAIRDCVYRAAQDDPQKSACDDASRNLLCVCVCDLRLAGDRSFLLWAILVMVASMNFFLPYLYFISFAETQGAKLSAWYNTSYCLGSLATRCIFINFTDYTFMTNRTLFQIFLIWSGIMWVCTCWAETFGWIIVCCLTLGLIEGALCVIISRLAILTIPRGWLGGAWLTCILCHTLGIFLMTLFTAIIAHKTLHYYIPFATSGIIQIIAAFLGFLLPNEEDEGAQAGGIAATPAGALSTYKSPYTPGAGAGCNPYTVPYSTNPTMSGCGGSGSGPIKKLIDYKCDCPICSKIGCLPGCLPQTCTPGGSIGKTPNN